MDKSNYKKQFIAFSDLRTDLKNAPHDLPMIVLDLLSKQLALFYNNEFYYLTDKVKFEDYLINGKLDISLFPQSFANKQWISAQIDKKTQNIFLLKGKKENLEQILSIENPNIGDVWINNQQQNEYVYTQQHEWHQLGKQCEVKKQQIQQINIQINKIYKAIENIYVLQNSLQLNKLAIQSQIKRAINQQNLIKNNIKKDISNIKTELKNQVQRSKNVEQILKKATDDNSKLINTLLNTNQNQIQSLKSLLSSYNLDELSTSLFLVQTNVDNQNIALKELYTNINIIQNNTDKKIQNFKKYVSGQTDNVSKLLLKAIQQNSKLTDTKIINLSTDLKNDIYNRINQTQQLMLNTFQMISGTINNAIVLSQITKYDNQFTVLSSEGNNIIYKIKGL